MTTKVLPYKKGSQSARALAEGLGVKRLRTANSLWVPKARDVVINWGHNGGDTLPRNLREVHPDTLVLNKPDRVANATNKLTCFETLQRLGNINIPEFTTIYHLANEWNCDGANPVAVVGRALLRGAGGRGIILQDPMSLHTHEFSRCPLFVKYVKKKYEYRIHVMNNHVISEQRKARNTDVPDDQINWQIRNHDNGFIFARNEGHNIPDQVRDQAILAVHKLGLDFGAVDVIWNEGEQKAYVLEVNTACGLEGQTLTDYVEGFKEHYNV